MTAADLSCTTDGCQKRGMRTVDGQWVCMWHPTEEPPEFDQRGKLIGKPTLLKSVTKTRDHTYRTPVAVPKHLLRDCCSTPTLDPHHPSCPHLTLSEELDVLEQHDPVVKAAAEGLAAATARIVDAAPADPIGTPAEVAAIEAGDLLALPDRMPPRDLELRIDVLAEHRQRREVVHVPPPHVEAAITALEEQLERMLDEVATVRALVREVRIAYATPAPAPAAPEAPAKPGKRTYKITPEGRERMRESGRRLAERNRAKAAAARVTTDV